ncbi:DNA-binding response regulator, partial [Ralstonia pseudosolanacearum]
VSSLRSKLGLRPDHGMRLAAIYGFGYRLQPVEDDAGQ